MKKNNIVYFELNNWYCGKDYPDEEPFVSWLEDDCNLIFENEKWIKENELCVYSELIDMSCNFCVTAKREWVEKNCPTLLTKHKEFLRYPEPNWHNNVYSKFGHQFLEYKPENIGLFCNY